MEKINWEKMIGHKENIAHLKILIQEDKMPHAMLFVGPEGIGKFLAAQVTAAALFCHEGEKKPCGECVSCRAFQAESHPDLIVVEADGSAIKIEQIRELQREAALAPYMTDKRVVIIKDAEKMTLPAANSLLKTLEEPVGNVVFILLAEQRHLLLDTILSRCTIMQFQPLPVTVLTAALMRMALAEEEAAVFARISEGSLGKALRMKASDGLQIRDHAAELLAAVRPVRMDSFWEIGARIGEGDRKALQELSTHMCLILRDLLVLHCDARSDLLRNVDIRDRLMRLKDKWPKRKIFFAINEIIIMQKMLRANANTRLVIEHFMMSLRD